MNPNRSNPKNAITASKLTDDLVVEVLSRLPYRSFCRFKCVCKAWLSFSADPFYCQKLPKTITGGLIYQEHSSYAIKLASACPDDGSIDTTLSFLPHYEQLELVDCCNGLVLCKYVSSSSTSDISHLIVCNPATRQWMALPETHIEQDGFYYTAMLAFNPSWSPHFSVFNFQEKYSPGEGITGVTTVGIFSSVDSTWFVDDRWEPKNEANVTCRPHFFLDGKLFVQTSDDRVLVIDAFHLRERPFHWTIELPGYKPSSPLDDCLYGCLGQSSGVLHYAQPESDGCTILIWSLEHRSWNVKYHLSMSDAFGRDVFLRCGCDRFWSCDYDIETFDLERGHIFLRDFLAGKLLSYSLSTGKMNEIQDGVRRYMQYVPYYSMFPIQEIQRDQDISEEP